MPLDIREVQVMLYLTPLREGGSLPAIAEADDGRNYVIKFRGAGHGPKGLIAEFIGGEIARSLGLLVPELVFAELDAAFGRSEGDEEIQDLLKWSQGLNIGMDYLPRAVNYDPVVFQPDGDLSSRILWLDAFITNIDRTARNTNMLMWENKLWLIDHGASLYFQHNWDRRHQAALSPFPMVKDHVLLPYADAIERVDAEYKELLSGDVLSNIIEAIPSSWLDWAVAPSSEKELREAYLEFLNTRLENSSIFVKEAKNAREKII